VPTALEWYKQLKINKSQKQTWNASNVAFCSLFINALHFSDNCILQYIARRNDAFGATASRALT
jgi:hypothetical protein